MPQIPIYRQRSTPSAGGSNPSMTADPAVQGLSQLGQGMARYGTQQMREAKSNQEASDRIQAAVLASKFDAGMYQHLQDAQAKAAPGADKFTDNFYSEFEKSAGAYETAAGSEFVKNMVRSHIAGSRESFGRSAMSFEATERARNYGRQIEDGLDTSAKTVYANPQEFERQMGLWSSTISATPIPPEARTALMENARKKVAWSAVTGMLDKMPAEAITNSSAWRALDAGEQAKARSFIDSQSKRAAAQQATASIMSEHGGDMKTALKAAREIEDPEVQDDTSARIVKEFALKEQQEKQAKENVIQRATNLVEKSRSVDSIPSSDLASMTLSERRQLRDYADYLSKGKEPGHSSDAWAKFYLATPEEQAKMNLQTELRPHIDDRHFDRALEIQKAARAPGGIEHTSFLGYKDRLENAVRSSQLFGDNFKPSKLKGDELMRWGAFETEADKRLLAFEGAKKAKATPEEQQQILDKMVTERVFVDKFGTDPQRASFELDQKSRMKAYKPIEEIPAQATNDAINYLRSIGALSQDATKDTYKKGVNKYQDIIERAYGARLAGATREEITAILNEAKK